MRALGVLAWFARVQCTPPHGCNDLVLSNFPCWLWEIGRGLAPARAEGCREPTPQALSPLGPCRLVWAGAVEPPTVPPTGMVLGMGTVPPTGMVLRMGTERWVVPYPAQAPLGQSPPSPHSHRHPDGVSGAVAWLGRVVVVPVAWCLWLRPQP